VTADAAQPTLLGGQDAFLAKVRPDGTIAYASYLGGSNWEYGFGVATDPAGNVYVVGHTFSTDFPVTSGALGAVGRGDDGFLTKFAPDGRTMLYSTYLAGAESDEASAIAVDVTGRAHVVGTTQSSDFPTTAGAVRRAASGQDAFYLRVSPSGALEYSTLLGGSGGDRAQGLTVDGSGNAYVVGITASRDFPVRRALKAAFPSTAGSQGFLARFTAADLDFATYIGGSGSDDASGVAVTPTAIYVGGLTCSWDF